MDVSGVGGADREGACSSCCVLEVDAWSCCVLPGWPWLLISWASSALELGEAQPFGVHLPGKGVSAGGR